MLLPLCSKTICINSIVRYCSKRSEISGLFIFLFRLSLILRSKISWFVTDWVRFLHPVHSISSHQQQNFLLQTGATTVHQFYNTAHFLVFGFPEPGQHRGIAGKKLSFAISGEEIRQV